MLHMAAYYRDVAIPMRQTQIGNPRIMSVINDSSAPLPSEFVRSGSLKKYRILRMAAISAE
jgi:hypothetical protein